jgi:hypothetical protein
MSGKEYFDKMAVVHTLRVEMMDGTLLKYNLSANEKSAFEELLDNFTDGFHQGTNKVVFFQTIEERIVFIRIKDIKNIIFCWDPPVEESEQEYIDNFKVAFTDEGELDIPDVIIKIRGKRKPLAFFDIDYDYEFLALDDVIFSNEHFLKSGFITLTDEDGERNFIPVTNISCIEATRKLIYSDEVWEELKRNEDMDNRKN